MEGLTKVYFQVDLSIQKDIDHYVKNTGKIEHNLFEICDKHVFNNYYFTKVFVFNKAGLFNRDINLNICILYRGGIGLGIYHHIRFNLDTNMYIFDETSDGATYNKYETIDWMEMCRHLTWFFKNKCDETKITNMKMVNL